MSRKYRAGSDLSGNFLKPNVVKIGGVAVTIDTDETLAANSDERLATQKAVKSYADNLSPEGGGRTLIAEVTPSDVGTITVASSISGSYKKLTLEFAVRSTNGTTSVDMDIVLNGDTTDANYRKSIYYGYAGGQIGAVGAANNSLGDVISANNSPAGSFTIGIIDIPQYANANFNKHVIARGSHRRDDSGVFELVWNTGMEWGNSAAINQIDLTLSAGNFSAGSVIRLYGEN
jgi:hypothetical protein